MRSCFLFIAVILFGQSFAQKKQAEISGLILDENDLPLAKVSISILGKTTSLSSSDSGFFHIMVPAEKAIALVFTHTGYHNMQKNFYLSPNESERITIKMSRLEKTMTQVVVSAEKERKEVSTVKINPKNALTIPGPANGVEGLIKTLVGSNNELSSQYSVRGGNYDENLVYINDIEIFRPYLVSNAQQEGLSMINPELASQVHFQSGGFQAKYGDKISSVLDIQYKKPSSFGGSAYLSMLEQGLHLENISKNRKFSYLFGVRNKTSKNILSRQATTGNYLPTSSDVQTWLSYQPHAKWQADLLCIFSKTGFEFYPEFAKKTSSVFSPLFSSNLGLDIYFEGKEKDRYTTGLQALTLTHTLSKRFKMKWILSRNTDDEYENFDIAGAYLFGDRDMDNSSTTFGQITNPLGAGYYQNYGRNHLRIDNYVLAHRGNYGSGRHFFQWGLQGEKTKIEDRLFEWEYQDSAGYSLPYQTETLPLFKSLSERTSLDIDKFSGFLQDNWHIKKGQHDISVQYGIRVQYNSLNKETLISPRLSFSWKPNGQKDLVWRASAGLYDQPPFYRELRNYTGQLNSQIKAQKSAQLIAGFDKNFNRSGRPFRWTTEAYYKSLWDVIPYDVDNVKIRYLGNNNAKAYSAGVECRLFGELVEGAESWFSIAYMNTKENLLNDHYYDYLNAAGEVIRSGTIDKVVADSAIQEVGWLRRPSDRRLTMGLFLQDYMSTNKNLKVHLNLLYGSNMVYNIPNSVKYRNALTIDPYIRVDIGFSALLLDEQKQRRSHSPFEGVKSIWASLEVFNLIDRANTISYQLVKDFSNNVYAIPNRLTPRMLNIKLVARF